MKIHNPQSRQPLMKSMSERPAAENHSINFIPQKQKIKLFFLFHFIQLDEWDGMKRKYYNSNSSESSNFINIKEMTSWEWIWWDEMEEELAAQQTTHQINPIFSLRMGRLVDWWIDCAVCRPRECIEWNNCENLEMNANEWKDLINYGMKTLPAENSLWMKSIMKQQRNGMKWSDLLLINWWNGAPKELLFSSLLHQQSIHQPTQLNQKSLVCWMVEWNWFMLIEEMKRRLFFELEWK